MRTTITRLITTIMRLIKLATVGISLLPICPAQTIPIKSQDDYSKELRDRLLDKVVTLKRFYSANQLKFDTQGNLRGHSPIGSFPLDAKPRIKRIDLKQDTLRLKADRLAIGFEQGNAQKIQYFLTPGETELDVQMTGTASQFDDLDKALQNIFISGREDVADYVPDYWRPIILRSESRNSSITGTPITQQPPCPPQTSSGSRLTCGTE